MSRELIFVIAGFLVLIAYHGRLYYMLRRRPFTTSIGIANYMRALWVRNVVTERKEILAVQTLRNLTMAANFLASTAIIIGLAILNVALGREERPGDSLMLWQFEMTAGEIWTAKLLVLSGAFFFCFFNFMLSVRYYNHAAFFVGVPHSEEASWALHKPGLLIDLAEHDEEAPTLRPVADTVNRGAAHYTLGMRGYYLVVPLALWLFGSVWFLVGAIGLVGVLYRVDSAG